MDELNRLREENKRLKKLIKAGRAMLADDPSVHALLPWREKAELWRNLAAKEVPGWLTGAAPAQGNNQAQHAFMVEHSGADAFVWDDARLLTAVTYLSPEYKRQLQEYDTIVKRIAKGDDPALPAVLIAFNGLTSVVNQGSES